MFFDNRDKEENYRVRRKNPKIEKSSKSNKRTELFFGVISAIAGLMSLSILINAYFVQSNEKTIGERLILNHFKINTPIYTIHFKPITLIVIFAFISWAFGLEYLYSIISNRSLIFKRVILIFFFTVAFVFFFEVIQNFMFWYAVYVINLGKVSPDLLNTGLTPSRLIVNFNVITKFFTLIFFCSIYGIFFCILKKLY